MALCFHDGIFRLVQFTDIQENGMFSPDTERLIRGVLQKEKPDLAVVTGDQLKGYAVTLRAGNEEENAYRIIDRICACFEAEKTPFTVLFGNHDRFGRVTKAMQWRRYAKSPCFVGAKEPEEDWLGVDCLPVHDKNGDIRFVIYAFDSGEKDARTGAYAPFPKKQMEWYCQKREEMRKEDGTYVPALAFQHIPVPEVYELMQSVPKGTRGAVRGAGAFSDRYFVLGNRVRPGSFMKENAAVPLENSGEFQVLNEKGDVRGLFFGHDHINSFSGFLNGMELGYTQSCGFNVYGPGWDRGARVFTVPEENPALYEHHTVTYRQLFGTRGKRPLTNLAYQLAPSSVSAAKEQAWKALRAGAVLAAGAAVLRMTAGLRKQ